MHISRSHECNYYVYLHISTLPGTCSNSINVACTKEHRKPPEKGNSNQKSSMQTLGWEGGTASLRGFLERWRRRVGTQNQGLIVMHVHLRLFFFSLILIFWLQLAEPDPPLPAACLRCQPAASSCACGKRLPETLQAGHWISLL